ncbi:MAG: MFS transporter [Vicinamibacteria bacterium]|nr:MFS transporter [Vicinamibacteria bacterium]
MSESPSGKIKIAEKIGYAVGDTASCLYFQTMQMFLMYFYTDTFGISAAAVGTMLLVTRIWDTANDPLMGMIADRTSTRFGKFRPWILWMIAPYAIVGVLTFVTPNLSLAGKLIYAYITYALLTMAYTAINIPYGALLGVMTANGDERTQLSSFRFLGAFSGNLIVQGTLILLVEKLGRGNDQLGYPLAIGVFALVASGLWFFTFSSTKERIQPPRNQKTSVSRDLNDLLHNRPWLVLCLMGVLTLVWVSLRNGAMMYYFDYYVGDRSKAAIFMVAGTICSLIGVSLTTFVTRALGGKKKAFIILSAANAALTAVFFIARPTDFVLMYASHLVGSLSSGPLMPLTWSMYADTADYGEWKFGRRATGLVFSAATFSQKMGWTIGGAAAGWVLAFFQYQPNMPQTEFTLVGIRLMMSILPAIGSSLVCVAALFYNLTEKNLEQIETDLASRRRAAAASSQ